MSFPKFMVTCLFLLMLLPTGGLTAQEMVADVNADTRDGFRGFFRTNGTEAVFFANDKEKGTELYKIAVPDAEPSLFFDELPGRYQRIEHSVLLDSLLFFSYGSIYNLSLVEANFNTGRMREFVTGDVEKFDAIKVGGSIFVLIQRSDGVQTNEYDRINGELSLTSDHADFRLSSSNREFSRVAANDSLSFFAMQDPDFDISIWRSNGTNAGTYQIFTNPDLFSTRDITGFLTFEKKLYFGMDIIADGSPLFRTTANGTGIEIVDVPTEGNDDVEPENFTIHEEQLWFTGLDDWNPHLYRMAGDTADKIRPLGQGSSQPTRMMLTNGHVFWGIRSFLRGGSIIGNDETMVSRGFIDRTYQYTSSQVLRKAYNDDLFYIADTPEAGAELWVIDSGGVSTRMVEDIYPGPVNSDISAIYQYGEFVYFGTRAGCLGLELFNGNEEGVEVALDAEIDGDDSSPQSLYATEDKLYFTAETGATGREVFVSGGTGGGTELLLDVIPGRSGGIDIAPVSLDGQDYFTILDATIFGSDHLGVYRTNGTPEGTVEIMGFHQPEGSNWSADFSRPPASEAITIDLPEGLVFTASVYSTEGKRVMTVNELTTMDDVLLLGIPSGSYLVLLRETVSGQLFTKKLIVQK